MLKIFDNLDMSRKLGVLLFVVMVCMTFAGFATVDFVRREVLAGRIEELRAIIDSAKGLAAGLEAQVATEKISRAEAERMFAQRVRSMTYDRGQGYIFAYRMDGLVIATPEASQIGTNRIDSLVNGRPVLREIRDAVAKNGEAVIGYNYPRAGEKVPAPKISYAAAFPAWNMYLGTGVYIDDLDMRFRPMALALAGGTIAVALVIAALAWLISLRITAPLARLQGCMQQLAQDQVDINVPDTGRRDEIGAMARAVEVLKDHVARARALEQQQAEAKERRVAEDGQIRREAEAAAAAEAAALVVRSIGSGLAQLAAGKLTFRLDAKLPEAYCKLGTDLNAAICELELLVHGIAASTLSIKTRTQEISNAADELSLRTEQQASSLEETVAALDEITATMRRTADGASHADKVVGAARTDAENSGAIVRQAVDAMGGIEQSSDKISQIIGVIDEIAFQTNLLALNAGVEAARAGEAGRGFAVVASEVRALAQRSAGAAKEIKALISTSAAEVSKGVDLVGETGRALERIVAQVNDISEIVSEIAASAKEQSAGLDHVNEALNQMDQVTQKNAAMVQESTSASHALEQETAQLSQLIARFELSSDRSATSAARKPGPSGMRDAAPKPVVALKTPVRGGAAAEPIAKAETRGWREF